MGTMLAARRRWTVLLGLLLLLLACGAGTAPAAGRKGLIFRLPTLEGRKVGPGDFRGKVVVIDFWATWCGPCFLQADILHRLHGEYPKKDVQFLAVNVAEDEKTVRAFVAKRPFPYPVLLDKHESVSGELGVLGLPTLLIVDRKGEISYLRPGIVPEMRLRTLLGEAGAPAPEAAAARPTPTPAQRAPVASGQP
jgi:thiol-disulfide isomerase/thioredoxin